MCVKKVACGLKKVTREDGREVLEPVFVEVDCPEDMHRVSGKIDSCKTVTPKIVEENTKEGEGLTLTVQNEHDCTHGGADAINAPRGSKEVTTDNKEVTTGNKGVATGNKEVTTGNKGVVCVETGEIFSSIRQASKSSNVDFSNIAKCCKGKLKTAGGKHWRYVTK